MPTFPNPLHDPAWEEVHHRHAAARDRAQEELGRLEAAGVHGGDVHAAAVAEFDRRLLASQATFRTRHRTVAKYAAWLFDARPADAGTGGGLALAEVDLHALRTVEEAEATWSRARRVAAQAAAERDLALPVGQPDGLRAFADPASPSLVRTWRVFSRRDLDPGHGSDAPAVRALVTAEAAGDGLHVCFADDADWGGLSVTNAVERLGTAVHREACAAAAGAPRGRRPGTFARLRAALGGGPAVPPGRFHVYEHHGPRGEPRLPETFERVEMTHANGAFRDPRWVRHAMVPRAIRSARFDLARGVPASGGVPRLPPPPASLEGLR